MGKKMTAFALAALLVLGLSGCGSSNNVTTDRYGGSRSTYGSGNAYNGGAKLSVEGSPVLEDVKALAAAGVKIFTCGTCLNFYGLGEKLAVGEVSNMYDIVDKCSKADLIIKP